MTLFLILNSCNFFKIYANFLFYVYELIFLMQNTCFLLIFFNNIDYFFNLITSKFNYLLFVLKLNLLLCNNLNNFISSTSLLNKSNNLLLISSILLLAILFSSNLSLTLSKILFYHEKILYIIL